MTNTDEALRRRPRWRDYRTPAGHSPVKAFLSALPDDARAEVIAAMKDVRDNGMVAARHLRGDIYEVRASHNRIEYRVLFASEGQRSSVFLSLEAFNKTTQRTPPDRIDLAVTRLRDWRSRGEQVVLSPSFGLLYRSGYTLRHEGESRA